MQWRFIIQEVELLGNRDIVWTTVRNKRPTKWQKAFWYWHLYLSMHNKCNYALSAPLSPTVYFWTVILYFPLLHFTFMKFCTQFIWDNVKCRLIMPPLWNIVPTSRVWGRLWFTTSHYVYATRLHIRQTLCISWVSHQWTEMSRINTQKACINTKCSNTSEINWAMQDILKSKCNISTITAAITDVIFAGVLTLFLIKTLVMQF